MHNKMTDEEIARILDVIKEVYKAMGKQIKTAELVKDIKEDGSMEGELLIDNRDTKPEDMN